MANRFHILRRRATLAVGTMFLGTVGCAFPHGSTGGDPMLGNFHRPIVPTPPPERGGLGLDSPAYDSGARIGVQSPDIPASPNGPSGFLSLPPIGPGNLTSDLRTPFGTPGDSTVSRRLPSLGARLPSPGDTPPRMLPSPGQARYSHEGVTRVSREALPAAAVATALANEPAAGPILPASHEIPRDASSVENMEDGFALLQAAGARGLRTEQLSSGEWLFACAVGSRIHEARGGTQFEAMKRVLDQIGKDR